MAGDQYIAQRINVILGEHGRQAAKSIEDLYAKLYAIVQEEAQAARINNVQQPRSIQGEHVINKSILEIRQDIISTFIETKYPEHLARIPEILKPNSSYQHYMNRDISGSIQENIRDKMVACIPQKVFYFDRNELIYRCFLRLLREFANNHMHALSDQSRSTGSPYQDALEAICDLMIKKDIFVDQDALDYWIKSQGGDQRIYNESRSVVQLIFMRLIDNMSYWVNESRALFGGN